MSHGSKINQSGNINQATNVSTSHDAIQNDAQQNSSQLALQIQSLQSKLSNIKVSIAVPIGVLMIIYFFTFAGAIDYGHKGLFYFEFVSTIVFVLVLVKLNHIGFWLIQKRYKNHKQYGPILKQLDMESIAMDAQKIADRLGA